MEQPLRLNMTSVTADQSRTNTIYTIQELLLEYSLVIIVLGCFLLISLSLKAVQEFGGSEGEASPLVYRSQWGWTLHRRHFISRKPERVQVHLYVKVGRVDIRITGEGCIFKETVLVMWTEKVWSLGQCDMYIFSLDLTTSIIVSIKNNIINNVPFLIYLKTFNPWPYSGERERGRGRGDAP